MLRVRVMITFQGDINKAPANRVQTLPSVNQYIRYGGEEQI